MNNYIVCYCGNSDFELPQDVEDHCNQKIDLLDKERFDAALAEWLKKKGNDFFFIASRSEFHHIFNALIKAGISYDRLIKPLPSTKEISICGCTYSMREEFLTNPSKPIDRAIAKDNLLLFKSITEKRGLQFFLAYGTLLGAIREADFISHDSDTDIGMYLSEKSKFLPLIFDLHDAGLELVRLDGNLLSFMRCGEYIDLYFFSKNRFPKYGWHCHQLFIPSQFLDELDTCEFHQNMFFTPHRPKDFLEYCYGKNWKTPIKNMHAQPLSSFKSYVSKMIPLRIKRYIRNIFHS